MLRVISWLVFVSLRFAKRKGTNLRLHAGAYSPGCLSKTLALGWKLMPLRVDLSRPNCSTHDMRLQRDRPGEYSNLSLLPASQAIDLCVPEIQEMTAGPDLREDRNLGAKHISRVVDGSAIRIGRTWIGGRINVG